MKVYAQQNDTVDAICWRHLGATAGVVEQTFELNPGLVDQGVLLKHGTPVILPDAAPVQAVKETVKLWD